MKKWNNFFGSKLNTVLLLVLIILMIVALRYMYANPEVYRQNFLTEQNERYTENSYINKKEKELKPEIKQEISLDLSTSYAQTYKTIFSEAFKKPANFNSHYVVASYGCGSGCMGYGIIDKETGKVFQGPSDDYGGNFQLPVNFESTRYSLSGDLFKVVGYSSINTYRFDGTKFILLD
ncbi:MAG: hypothetical protein RI945_244 [Candidatus Parcubacteria bacterium]